MYSKIVIYPPHPKKKKPAAKFASQGDAHVRTDAQIKFHYYLYLHYLYVSVLSVLFLYF